MMLVEETTVADAALPVDAFKAHMRLGTGFAESTVQDAVLISFLRAAMAAIEARTGKMLIARTFVWNLTAWRDAQGQALPVAPVASLDAVTLVDRVGTPTVLDADSYRLGADTHRPRLRPAGACLPRLPQGGAVDIRFTAGFGTWDDVPDDLAQAVFLLAAHYYEYRNETGLGQGCMPFGVTSLIERYRPVRIYAGGAA